MRATLLSLIFAGLLNPLPAVARDYTIERDGQRLDQLTGQELFVPLFRQVAGSRDLPDFETLYGELGIELSADQVQLRHDHPGAGLRRGTFSYPGKLT